MSDSMIKLIFFICWPIFVPILLALIAIVCGLAWFAIPFARVVRDGNKINLKLGN